MIAARRIATPEQVLAFWFGAPIVDPADAIARARRWFGGGPAMDGEVRARFLPTIEAALRGDLDVWAETPHGRVALVLVLDQLTRNAYRGDPRTWSGDARAQRLALEAIDRGLDAELSFLERVFLAMPLHHAEDPELQRRSRDYAERLHEEVPAALAPLGEAHSEQTAKYHDIIARFGRFPFRNAVLGRDTTEDERVFLSDFAEKGAPKAMRGAA